jgi:DNA repair protein RadC
MATRKGSIGCFGESDVIYQGESGSLKALLAASGQDVGDLNAFSLVHWSGAHKGLTDACKRKIDALKQLASLVSIQEHTQDRNTQGMLEFFLSKSWEDREYFMVTYHDSNGDLLGSAVMSVGNQSSCMVDPKILFRDAMIHQATSITIAHNHPSGTLEPSPSDRELTNQLVKGSNVLGIKINDHYVVTHGKFLSIRSQGDTALSYDDPL